MRKLIERCPACGGELIVTHMACHQCHTRVDGRFRPSVFDRLSPESLAFVELFVRSKGNMKELERELDVAYRAVRHRLDEVVRELGPPRQALTDPLPPPPPPPPPAPPVGPTPPTPHAPAMPPAGPAEANSSPGDSARRRETLDRLDRGEITVDEAVRLLGGST